MVSIEEDLSKEVVVEGTRLMRRERERDRQNMNTHWREEDDARSLD